MLRKLIGFLPAVWWSALILVLVSGNGWDFTIISANLWIWLGLSAASAVCLCFDGILLPVGLLTGFLTNTVSCLVLSLGEPTDVNRAVCICMGVLAFFYVLYTVCYITYHRELNK